MWLLMASGNGGPGMLTAAQILREGGQALDAVERGTRCIESNAQDETVGLGGLPNILGQVELDASIMDGRNLAAGAVGALHGFEHPVSVARRVMELTPHVMLVGDGAERFAREMGFAPCELLTEQAQHRWHDQLAQVINDEEIAGLANRAQLLPVVSKLIGRRLHHGTVNFLARDQRGDLACAVSTSGWGWKYPGRLGDSPIIGAGNYADNRYGAAACTGYGELSMRASTARSTVLYMKMGLTLQEACEQAMLDLQPLVRDSGGMLRLLALDCNGHPFGISTEPKGASYLIMSDSDTGPQALEYRSAAV